MKAFKRIIIWILISLGMQIAVLYYVDNYLFSTENVNRKITSRKVEKDDEKNTKNIMDIEIPDDAEHVSISCDGEYLSYYKNGELNIVDVYTSKNDKVQLNNNLEVSFYKWASDRNILIISAKKKYEDKAKFVFYSYDASKGDTIKLETKEQVETAFTANRDTDVEDIQLSPYTNMTYVRSCSKGGKCAIHKIDIMQKIKKVETQVNFIDDVKIIPNDDRLLYESKNRHKVYITGREKPINIKGVEKLCLIDVDDNDNIYVGELDAQSTSENIKIKNIYFGTISEKGEVWNKISLDKQIDKKDVIVSRDGKVYLNDDLTGVVREINSNKQINYKGVLLQIYNGGIASKSEGKLIETPLE